MPQTLVQPRDITGDAFFIKAAEAHHLIRVLRKKINDEIDLFDGQGTRYRGKITHIDPHIPSIEGRILKTVRKSEKKWQLTLFHGLPKGTKFDFVIEKATELGVDRIIPFLSRKSPIRLESSQVKKKWDRWNKLARAASKQCGRSDLPVIESVAPLRELEGRLQEGQSLLLAPGPSSQPLNSFLKTVKSKTTQTQVNIIIGPEAGLDKDEVNWLVERGGIPVHIGERIYRTESAGLVILSILNYELDLF